MSTRKQVNQTAIEASIDSHDFDEQDLFEIEQKEHLDNYCQYQDDWEYIQDYEWYCDFIPF